MKKTFNQTMPCAVRLAALLLVPAVCVAFSGCSAVPGSSGSSAAEPSPSPAAAEPAAKPDLPSLRPLYQGDENGYYTFMTAASGDYQQVLYADYQTGTQAPACHITGCTHDSPSCPACFFTGVPVTLPCPVGDGTYLSFVYGYDSDGMSIVRLNQDYGVEQVLYHCNYISSFYCYTDGSSLWFSTCPSGDSYDRIKRLDLSTGGITTLFDAGDTSGQSANIIGCTGRQLVVSVSPYYDSSEPQTSCLYLVDADTGAAELLREYPITSASTGRTTNISTAVLDDTLYEYDYTTGELTATGGKYGAGIGGGEYGIGNDITITGGEVNATGGRFSAGIGGGSRGTGSDITISGGEVNASGGVNGAGIGGGLRSKGKDITVSGDTKLKVQGGDEDHYDGAGAGIGDGGSNAYGTKILGAEVEPDTSGLTTNGSIAYYAPGADMENDKPTSITFGTSSQPEKPIEPAVPEQPEAERGMDAPRSEERRVGKECRSRWSPYH